MATRELLPGWHLALSNLSVCSSINYKTNAVNKAEISNNNRSQKTYLKRRSKQFLQNRCPHDVCQGSMKTFSQNGHWSRSSSLSTNFTWKVDLRSTARTIVYSLLRQPRFYDSHVLVEVVPRMYIYCAMMTHDDDVIDIERHSFHAGMHACCISLQANETALFAIHNKAP